MSEPATPVAAPSARLDWVDAARGACVFAVVLFHVTLWHVLPLLSREHDPATQALRQVNAYLGSLRMPLLLLISGLLAASTLRRGLGDGKVRLRIAFNAYLYLVWLVVYTVFYLSATPAGTPHRIDSLGEAARRLVLPETPLWYVFAMALYAAVLAALHRVPPLAVLVGLAVLSVVTSAVSDGDGLAVKVPLAVFFAAGVYGAATAREPRREPRRSPAAAGRGRRVRDGARRQACRCRTRSTACCCSCAAPPSPSSACSWSPGSCSGRRPAASGRRSAGAPCRSTCCTCPSSRCCPPSAPTAVRSATWCAPRR
ncbi:hypothetical protein GCM10025868_14660 [Angustibacter aerolatus]|uniref:Acyltransferase 3 domain-containing protein n=1 Tax=Angustibacter aerolatus TaxID=1162965 RepID=A0ABQ6JDF5_9ACTN|nr:acyltransferase family protein [Angustibacter aerolatus]GMA86216.1 hypothetical protein GCM10025868_14660 [Angustibacter aerolatus]